VQVKGGILVGGWDAGWGLGEGVGALSVVLFAWNVFFYFIFFFFFLILILLADTCFLSLFFFGFFL
jgi:hypothetical protein